MRNAGYRREESQGWELVVSCGRQETTNSVVENCCRNENRDVNLALETSQAGGFLIVFYLYRNK